MNDLGLLVIYLLLCLLGFFILIFAVAMQELKICSEQLHTFGITDVEPSESLSVQY